MNDTNQFINTNCIYRARDSLAAAKKAYRQHKPTKNIYILDTNTNRINEYDTSTCFSKKKDFQLKR